MRKILLWAFIIIKNSGNGLLLLLKHFYEMNFYTQWVKRVLNGAANSSGCQVFILPCVFIKLPQKFVSGNYDIAQGQLTTMLCFLVGISCFDSSLKFDISINMRSYTKYVVNTFTYFYYTFICFQCLNIDIESKFFSKVS